MNEENGILTSKIDGEDVVIIIFGTEVRKGTVRLTPEQAINIGADLMEHATKIIRRRTKLRTKQHDTV